MATITIIGTGQMAAALTFPLAENGHTVRCVGSPLDLPIIEELKKSGEHLNLKRKLPKGLEYYRVDQMKEALEGADLILGGVSSFGVDWFADSVLPLIDPNVPVFTVTKGMINQEDGTLITYPDYWNQQSGNRLNLNAIGGPCTSYELADHDDSWVTFCGSDPETLKKLKELFETDYYHVSLSEDVKGVELAVALKNAYALAVTLAVGLAEKREGVGAIHYNSQAALFEQSLKEISRLLELNGAKQDNLFLSAGDLYVTIYGGRTRKIGTLLGRGYTYNQAIAELEGVTLESIVITKRCAEAIRELAQKGKANPDDFPLLMHIDEIINRNKPVQIPWEKFV